MKILLSPRTFPDCKTAEKAMNYVFRWFEAIEQTHPRVWRYLQARVEDPVAGPLQMSCREERIRLSIRAICGTASSQAAPHYRPDGMEPYLNFDLASTRVRPAMSYDEAIRIIRTPVTGVCKCDAYYGFTCRFCELKHMEELALGLIESVSETMVDAEIRELVPA
jgi:hypothetical protein